MSVIAVPYHTDDPIEDFALPVSPDSVLAPTLPDTGSSWHRMAELYATVAVEVAARTAQNLRTVVLSGDCTTSLGVVAGLQRGGIDGPGIVWFDAHGDLQTPQTTYSGYLGGMPLRMLLGTGDRTVPDRLGLRPVPEADVVLVDARDLDEPEADFLAASDVRHVAVPEVVEDVLPSGPLYLHLDLDIVDPREVPGLLYPTPGGPSRSEVFSAVGRVLDTGRVYAIGIGCTWHPERTDAATASADLIRGLIDQFTA